MEEFEAVVGAKILELRFPFSGQVNWIGVAAGDQVKPGQELARLNPTSLKKKHQKELKDYEKIRATFEQIKKKLVISDEPDKKYLMDRAQADLDASVLAVEITHHQIEQARLKSPVDGTVADDGNLVAGLNISPASFAMKIIDNGSYFVSAKLPQEQLGQVKKDQPAEFTPVAFPEKVFKGRVLRISPLPEDKKSKNFTAIIVLENYQDLRPGMTGKLKVNP